MKGNAIHPDFRKRYPVAERGQGIYIFDSEGKRYMDGSSGAVTVNIGHGVKEIARAMAEQAEKLAFSYRTQFTNAMVEQLATKVAELAPGDLDHAFFVNSGSEATEIALKFAQHYWAECGQPAKRWVISRWTGYHGSTLGALSMSGNVLRRKKYSSMLEHFPEVSPPYCYRCPVEKTYPSCQLFCARELETAILRLGPENVAAFIAEPIIGASGGAIAPPDDYWPLIRGICDRYGVLLIADEVMTGFGRTGANFAVDHWSVVPDLIALGKGITGGYAPLAGVVVSRRIYEAIERGSGLFTIGHTYSGNPLCCAVGCRVLDYVAEHQLVGRAEVLGRYLRGQLDGLVSKHQIIGDLRGRGLFAGLELVRDRRSREPFDFKLNAAGRLAALAFARGLIVYPCRGAVEGAAGDAIMVAPPLVITEGQIDELVALLDGALTDLARDPEIRTAMAEPA